MATLPSLLAALRAGTDAMIGDLDALVTAESPSDDLAATTRCADLVAKLGEERLGAAPEWIDREGRPHLRWTFGPRGAARVVLLAHLDTVWPLGTTSAWPFALDGSAGTATGPGAFDMKAGLVQAFYALARVEVIDGVALVVTSDEEVGSPTSRALVEETAAGADAALVLEPAAGQAVKTGRKGVSMYVLEVAGRAAHAGLEPERGVNALVELAAQVPHVTGLACVDRGTTVTPTVASAGTATNVVPAGARCAVDVRCRTADEQARVDAGLRSLTPTLPGAALAISGGPNRPPMAPSGSTELFAAARRVAEELGLDPLLGVEVGGGSDGNFTAGLGVPTLDGLGAVGDGAHALGEHVVVASMAERAALVAGLVTRLLGR